jgi:ribosomal protein S6--L-glutamate ligase
MRIAVLAGGEGWHVRDLQRAATSLGHEAVAVDFRKISAHCLDSRPPHSYSLPSLSDYDAIVVRTMPPGSLEQVIFRMDVLHELERHGVRVLNPPRAVEICVDKYWTSARLAAAGLAVPATVVCQHADAAVEAFAQLGGDVVVKPLFGSEGRGMVRVSDPELAWRTFRAIERTQSILYLQQYIAHPGWDLRVFVLGGGVLAAMRRHAGAGGWRTNVAQGGRAERWRAGPEESDIACRAADVVGAKVAGVDLLPGPDGNWYVLEVNAVPGWRALAPVCAIDIAGEMIRYLEREVTDRQNQQHCRQ